MKDNNNNTTEETTEAVVVGSSPLKSTNTGMSITNDDSNNPKTNGIIKLDTKGGIDLSRYTTEELEKYKTVAVGLNVNDNNSILNYGLEVSNKLANTSSGFLQNVRQFDAGEIGDTITDMLSQINMIEIDPSEQSGVKRVLMKIPLVKTLVKKTTKIFQKYDYIKYNIKNFFNLLFVLPWELPSLQSMQ